MLKAQQPRGQLCLLGLPHCLLLLSGSPQPPIRHMLGVLHVPCDVMKAAYMSYPGSGGIYDMCLAVIRLIHALPGPQDNHICIQTTGEGATKHFPKSLYRQLQPKGWKYCQEYIKSINTSYASSLQNITLR